MIRFSLHALPLAGSGAAILAFGAYVASRRRFDPLGLSFLAACMAPALWLLGFTGAALSADQATARAWIERVGLLGILWIPSTSYGFAATFARRPGRLATAAAACAVSAFFVFRLLADPAWLLAGMRRLPFGWYPAWGPGMKYFAVSFAGLTGASLAELGRLYLASTSGLERRQTLWVMLGFLSAASSAWDGLPAYGLDVYPLGFLFMLGFVASFAYALEAYDLMDLRTAFAQTVAYVFAGGLCALPLLAALRALRPELLRAVTSGDGGLELVIGACLVACGLYWRWAGRRLLSLLQRRQTAMRRALDELSRGILFSSGLRETVDAALSALTPLLDLYHMSFWRYAAGGGEARLVAARNAAPPAKLELPGALRARLERAQEVLELRDLPSDEASLAFLKSCQAALLLPIRKGAEPVGFFVVGPKRTLRAFKGAELALLNDFLLRLSSALGQALLADQVHELASQVMLAEQRAREVEKIKADFLGAVSHELRTPLFALSGYAEALAGAGGDGEEARFARVIQRAAQRISGLVADMIRAASVERGSTEVRPAWFDLAAAARRVVEPFRSRIGVVRFSLELSEEPLWLRADRDKIEDLLFRLLSNAVKFSPPDGAVQVWGRRVEGDVELGVADEGPGLSPQARARLFEKFNRPYAGADEVNLRNPGSGLGLYIARTLVELHRGAIALDESARGCRIVVRLPQPEPVPANLAG